MKRAPVEDETNITEITLQPDGQVYVFGTSREVLEILELLDPGSPRLLSLLEHVRETENQAVKS